jgi:hypothetical protein
MLLVEQKQGAQPHPTGSRSKTRPIRSRREFCLFVRPEVNDGPPDVPDLLKSRTEMYAAGLRHERRCRTLVERSVTFLGAMSSS